VHSQLFIACSILKYHSAHVRSRAEDAHAEYALTLALYKAQEALLDFYANFPVRTVACVLQAFTFATGRLIKKPSDQLIRELGDLIMEDNPVRQNLGQFVYLDPNPEGATGRVENTYQLLLELGPVWASFLRAQRTGAVQGATLTEQLQDAADKNIIQPSDISRLQEYDARRFDCVLTDEFDKL
jgi:acyl-CoA dehydrogenase